MMVGMPGWEAGIPTLEPTRTGPDDPAMRSLLFLGLLVLPVLAGCQRIQVVAVDRSSGVAVVNARAITVGEPTRELDQADSQGRLSFAVPAEGTVALQAQGFLLVSHPAAWWLAQPQPVEIPMEPVWLAEFQRKGTGKPSQIIERKPCPCHRSQ